MSDRSTAIATLFGLMRAQHGVASCRQARAIGVSADIERRLRREGSLSVALPGVLAAGGLPPSRRSLLMAATLVVGVIAISHGAAARVHGLAGYAHHRPIDVIGDRGTRLPWSTPLITHYSRGPLDDHVDEVDGIAVTSLPLTLVHLAPALGATRLVEAVGEALGRGCPPDRIRRVATAWRCRGRAGPALVIDALDRTDGRPALRPGAPATGGSQRAG